MSSQVKLDRLIELAREARERAHAPYSNFKVGAVVECRDGRVFAGCNVENASYTLGLCAERVAIFKAVSEGACDLTRVVVIADSSLPVSPCGACRQIISEFLPAEAEVVMMNLHGQVESKSVAELLPAPFNGSFL